MPANLAIFLTAMLGVARMDVFGISGVMRENNIIL